MVKRLSTLVVLALASGCVDARDAYDDYAARVVDAGAIPPSVECPSPDGIGDISGQWLYGGLATPGQAMDIRFLVDIAYTAGADGGGTANFSLAPLRVVDGVPSGTPIETANIAVTRCGRFTVPTNGRVPADANPVLPSDLDIEVTNDFGIFSPTFGCGTLVGVAVNLGNAPLMGTFAIQKVTPGEPLPASKNNCAAGGF